MTNERAEVAVAALVRAVARLDDLGTGMHRLADHVDTMEHMTEEQFEMGLTLVRRALTRLEDLQAQLIDVFGRLHNAEHRQRRKGAR